MGEKIRFPDGSVFDVETGEFEGMPPAAAARQEAARREAEAARAEAARREAEAEVRKRRVIIGIGIAAVTVVGFVVGSINRQNKEAAAAEATAPVADNSTQTPSYAYVTSYGLNVRSGPSQSYGVKTEIRKGTQVQLLAGPDTISGIWRKIKVGSDEGWVDSTNLQIAVVENNTKPAMVKIPGGTFTMGSPAGEAGRDSDEVQHQVTVGSFYMSKYEVTAGEFRRFVNDTGYKTTAETDGGGLVSKGGKWVYDAEYNWKNPGFAQNDTQPAVFVSWYDAVEYCNWRSRAEGLAPAYRIDKSRKDPNNQAPTEHEDAWRNDRIRWTVTRDLAANGYRLPTEAEWEYACRAGTVTRYWSGNEEESLAGKANVADQTGKAKYSGWTAVNIRDGYAETAPVGSYAPNPWGLYDMHGNVYEWCWDWYGGYGSAAQTDPAGPSSGGIRVVRGGSWGDNGGGIRSANRGGNYPSLGSYDAGIRPVRMSSGG
ncbi:MAG: SUMF1/EgtB/PvdO family nonheme iron enzyme [Treponema sp.]|jgi:formylglycine-generating enzyme required for sulfatase activity|nr:SUMF1/EgtB/PvdO family nonheme iron enzyme [Treponema sp.]